MRLVRSPDIKFITWIMFQDIKMFLCIMDIVYNRGSINKNHSVAGALLTEQPIRRTNFHFLL